MPRIAACIAACVAVMGGCHDSDDTPEVLFGTWTRTSSRGVLEEGYRVTYFPDHNFDIVYTNGGVRGGTWRWIDTGRIERCEQPGVCQAHDIAIDGDLMLDEGLVLSRSLGSGLTGGRWWGQACVVDVAGTWHCYGNELTLDADGTAHFAVQLSDPQAPMESWTGRWIATELGAEVTPPDSDRVLDFVYAGERLCQVGFRRTIDLR